MSSPTIPKVCRLLRTKTAFNADPEGELWKLGDATTEAFWCLSSMEPFGPDGSFCHPHQCGQQRSCYRAANADIPVAMDAIKDGAKS